MSEQTVTTPTIVMWGTKKLEDLTRDEMIDAVKSLGRDLNSMFENRQRERRVMEAVRGRY